MGLHSGGGPPGLASILRDSPRDHSTLTSLDLIKLSSNLQRAVEYVVGGAAVAAASYASPVVSGGHIDYAAVEQHIQQGMLAAVRAATCDPESEPEAAEAARLPAPGAAEQPPAGGAAQPITCSNAMEEAGGSGPVAAAPHEGQQPEALGAPGQTGDVGGATSPPPSRQPAAAASEGRLGPPHVSLVEARGECDIDGLCVLSRSNFSTVRSNACVFKGRWMYELQLGSAGIMQVGWTTLQARFNSEDGVGDTHDSYAYDGRRRMRWHVNNHPYGEHWAAGDTIGCCLDLDGGTMRFLRNGKDLGEAFRDVRRGMPGMAYFAGVSLSFGERCEVNLGGRPFRHPVDGYRPLQQAPVAPLPLLDAPQPEAAGPADERRAQVAAARYLAACLSRLVDVSSPQAASLEEATAAPAASAATGSALPEEGSEQGGIEATAGQEQHAALPPLPHWVADAGRVPPDGGMLQALAAAGASKGTASAEEAAQKVPVVVGGGGASAGVSGAALCAEERLLLGSLLAQFLGPLCFDPYIAEGVLLELFDDTAGELGPQAGSDGSAAAAEGGEGGQHGGQQDGQQGGQQEEAAKAAGGGKEALELGRDRLAQLLRLLGAVLEREELAALAAACCEALARRARGCQWRLAELPGSAALCALRLWSAMLDCDELREAWLASPGWEGQLERLLAVRQPSEEDLKELLANLKVEWTGGGAVVRSRRRNQSLFASDLARLTSGLERVEAAQADILLRIWLQPGGDDNAAGGGERASSASSGSGGRSSDGQSEAGEEVVVNAGGAASCPEGGSDSEADPAARAASPAAEGGPEAAPAPSRGLYLRRFLSLLIDKNRGALRHVPPPGLSDQTALASAAFALLRLMYEHVAAALPEVPEVRWDPAQTFLRGVAPGGGEDPYHDAGRMGGTLSHLAREHPPTGEDWRPLGPVALGAVVKYDAPLRLAGRALEGPSFSDVWVRDRLLMLCHLAVAPLMRGALGHMGAMQAAMAGLRAVGSSEERGSSAMLEQTRRDCRAEFVRALRAHEWAQAWLLPPWRQQAAFVLAVATAQLVGAVSSSRSNLLRYVPEFYVTAPLDMVHAIHRCEPAVLDHSVMLELGLGHVLELVVGHLQDERIVSPEVQARLANMVLDGVQELDLVAELGSNAVSRRRLLPSMMRLLGHTHLWGQASNFFTLLVEGCGFLQPPAAFPPDFAQPVAVLRGLMLEACQSDPELCSTFLHHLFDHLNRMLTELVAALESAEGRLGRPGLVALSPSLLRLLVSTADYSVVLLRMLEVLAAQLPQLFLGSGGDMNLTRVAEVLGFAVPQFVGGQGHRVLQRLADSPTAQLRLRSAHLLQPLAGILLELWQAEQRGPAAAGGGTSSSGSGSSSDGGGSGGDGGSAAATPVAGVWASSLLRALSSQAALTDGVLQGLLAAEMAEVEPLAAEVAAVGTLRSAEAEAELAARHSNDMRRLGEAVDALVAARRAAGGGDNGGEGGGEGDAGDAPDEFLDPILATLMADPVLLPDSRVTVDRATIERHLLSSATDPFSRAPLARHQLQPDGELRRRIEAWRAQRAQQRRRGAGPAEG